MIHAEIFGFKFEAETLDEIARMVTADDRIPATATAGEDSLTVHQYFPKHQESVCGFIEKVQNAYKRTQERTTHLEECTDDLIEAKPIILSGQDAIDFAEMVLANDPPEPTPALKRAFELHRKLIVSE
jgi:hypothetical protein